MTAACIVTRAENAAGARIERREDRLARYAAEIAAEYMQAAKLPLITTVSTPGNLKPRAPFLDIFTDDIAEHSVAARVVAVLMRDEAGRALMQELADKHGAWFCTDVESDE